MSASLCIQTKCEKVCEKAIIEFAFETFLTKLQKNGGVKGRLTSDVVKEFQGLGSTFVNRNRLEYTYKNYKRDPVIMKTTSTSSTVSRFTTPSNHDAHSHRKMTSSTIYFSTTPSSFERER